MTLVNPKRIKRLQDFFPEAFFTGEYCCTVGMALHHLLLADVIAMQTASGYKKDKLGGWISTKICFIKSLYYFRARHPILTQHLKGLMYGVLYDSFVFVLMPASIGSCQAQLLRFACKGSFNV